MPGGNELYTALKKISQKSNPASNLTDVVYGLVKSVSPLQIYVENKFTIEEDQLILSPFCKRKTVLPPQIIQSTHTHTATEGSIGAAMADISEIELWRGLQENDNVIMLRISQGQEYYVMERVDDL